MCLWSQRAGDPTWEPSRLPGLKWAGQMPSSSPAPLIPKGPSHLPLLISLVSFLRSQDPHYLEGTLEGRRLAWELSRFPMPQWAGQTPSAPFPFLWSWRGPPACLSCSLPASLLCLQDQPGPEGTSEGIGPGLRAGQTSPADWARETLGAIPPDPSPQGSLQAWEPLPTLSRPSGAPDLSGLHFSFPHFSPFSSPTSYLFAWGFFPSPWASGSLTSIWQVP